MAKRTKKLLPYLYHGDPRAAAGSDPCAEVEGYAAPPASIQRRCARRVRAQAKGKK